MNKSFKNGDLELDLQKHLSADKIHLVKNEIEKNKKLGITGAWILDVNDDGYWYLNQKDRDHDFILMSKLMASAKKKPLSFATKTIKAKDIAAWYCKEHFIPYVSFQKSGMTGRKEIGMTNTNFFEVWTNNHTQLVHRGMNVNEATKIYNSI